MQVDRFYKHKNNTDVCIAVGNVYNNAEGWWVTGTWYNVAGNKHKAAWYAIDGSTETIRIDNENLKDWIEYSGPDNPNTIESKAAENLAQTRLQRTTKNAVPDNKDSRQR